MKRAAARIAMGIAAVAALILAGDRVRRGTPPHDAEWLQAGDVRVRTLRTGHGDTTLVLLHGFGESLMSWRSIVDRLAMTHRVIALDLPGFGLSDKPVGPYNLAAMTDRLADFVDRWTSGPVVLVGHSMGGELAASLALARPARVVGLVLIAPAGDGLTTALDSLPRGAGAVLGFLTSASGYVLPVHDPSWLREPAEARDYDPFADPAHRLAVRAMLREFDFAALRGRFGEIRQPVLLIWGRDDPTIPFSVGQRVAALLPCRRFVPLNRALHRPQQATPDTVAALIDHFVASPGCGPRDTASLP